MKESTKDILKAATLIGCLLFTGLDLAVFEL